MAIVEWTGNYLGYGLAVCGVYLLWFVLRTGRRDPRLPPGPPTIPVLGNAHQIPITGLGKSPYLTLLHCFGYQNLTKRLDFTSGPKNMAKFIP